MHTLLVLGGGLRTLDSWLSLLQHPSCLRRETRMLSSSQIASWLLHPSFWIESKGQVALPLPVWGLVWKPFISLLSKNFLKVQMYFHAHTAWLNDSHQV
jgi:hypothetical protein